VNTPDGKTKWQPITFKDKPQYIHQIFNEGNLLWICSDYGLFRYDASVHLSQSLTYNALITKVTLNNDSVCFWENQTIDPVSKKLLPSFLKKKISYTFNSVLFDFAATSYIKESDNEYRYKLDGFDKEWSPWSGKMAKEYTNLHEGTYCFKVQSRNILGQESTIAEFHFVVAAPWYRTLWAYLLYVAFAGLFFYLGLKTYTKSLKEINLKLERTVAERTLEIKQQAIQLEKLSLVARETDNAVVLIDRDFKIEWVNEGFTRLYGFTLDEYIARHGRSLVEFSVNPKIGETINQCVQTKKSVVYQTESPTKIGKTVWTQTTLTPILDSNGEIEKFVVLETDIHKLKEAERAIIAQAKELSKANAVLEETQSELLQQKEELLQVNTTLQDSNDKISHQNDFIQSSIRYAKNIQEAILPLSERLDKYVDWAVIYQPKDIVSGDFYWFARLSGREEFILATIDCTGHGVPGAFMSMVAERLLNEVVKINGIHNPAEILTAVDASLKKALKQDKNQNNDGMDITLCLFNRLDDDKTKVIYAGAKTKLYYFKQIENKILTIKGDSKHIGGQLVSRHHEEFHNHELILDKGDTLVMLTDGIIDQNDCNRKRFGTQKLVKILEENINLSTTELRDCVFNELNTHMEGTAQRDDITVFFVRI
jgi:PAS domain S-box-containing protein